MMSNLRIGLKLALAFTVTTILTLVLGALAWSQMSRIDAGAEDLATNWLPSVQAIGNVRVAANRVRRTEGLLFGLDDGDTPKARADLQDRMALLAKAEASYAPLVTEGEEKRLFDQYRAERDKYQQVQAQLLQLPASARAEVLQLFVGASERSFDALANTLGTLSDFNRASADKAVAAVRDTYDTARTVMLVLISLTTAIAAALAWWITGLITRPIGQAVQVAQGVAQGDLTMVIESRGKDEAAQLMQSLAEMRGSLLQVVGNVRANAESVATASAQIEQGNIDLSSRTEEQASALEQTAASMEELSSTVTQNADNARQASHLAQDAAATAARSGDAVSAMVTTMRSIDEASREIAEIIGLIDGIAFQTNILALNAAVEAARAGEQGRGFAVVATEVRSLAQRSAGAAKDIKALIDTSALRVKDGAQQAEHAGASMREVLQSIDRVATIVAEISTATQEQSSGISQVGEAVTQMDQTTQQNAALVEESAAAASSLKGQAQQLVAAVSVFKLTADARALPAPALRLQGA